MNQYAKSLSHNSVLFSPSAGSYKYSTEKIQDDNIAVADGDGNGCQNDSRNIYDWVVEYTSI